MKTIRDICKEYGYGQTELAERFGIPLRTVQNWHSGHTSRTSARLDAHLPKMSNA